MQQDFYPRATALQCQYKAALGGLRAEAALKLGKNPHVEMPITAVITVELTSARLS